VNKIREETKMNRYLLAVFMSVFCIAALADCTTIEPFVKEDQDIGIVLMHGKNGTPHGYIATLAGSLRRAGLQVKTPEMPWSRNRIYAKSYEDSMLEIDKAVNRLKSKGATRIVIAGHSLGANAALGYAARREGLSGVIVIAAGHFQDLHGFQKKVGFDWLKAKDMVDSGKGKERASFTDINQGGKSTRYTTANIYLSWFNPMGPANFPQNTINIKKGTPLLWITGTNDYFAMMRGSGYAFDLAPENPKNKYVLIEADHFTTPTKSINVISEWLRTLR